MGGGGTMCPDETNILFTAYSGLKSIIFFSRLFLTMYVLAFGAKKKIFFEGGAPFCAPQICIKALKNALSL